MNKNQEVGKYLEEHWIRKLNFVGNSFKTQKACKLASLVGFKGAWISFYEPKKEIYIMGERINVIIK